MLKIDKSKPIPKQTRKGAQRVFPWLEMRVGDSFLHPGKPNSARVAASWASKKYGRTFSTREKNGRVRIWRTK